MYNLNVFVKASISIIFSYILSINGCGPVRELEESTTHWSYSGYNNSIKQSSWNNQIATCGGTQQSPVDIKTNKLTTGTASNKLSFTDSSCTSFSFTTNDHGYVWKKNTKKTNEVCDVTVSTSKMALAQFHIHMPSEHAIDGVRSDVEIHFVHTDEAQENYRVIGVRMNIMQNGCGDNPWINDIFKNFPTDGSISIRDSYMNFIEKNGGFYNYKGSLTTPPCSETVDWWVMKETLQISRDQYYMFLNQMKKLKSNNDGKNSRDLQPLNGRAVTFYN